MSIKDWEKLDIVTRDKIVGIYNRFRIAEKDILIAMGHLSKKYELSNNEALTKLFSLAFDNKLDLAFDEDLYRRHCVEEYHILFVENI